MKLLSMAVIVMFIFLSGCQSKNSGQNNTLSETPAQKTDSLLSILDKNIPVWQKTLNIPNVGVGVIEGGKIAQVKVYGNLKNGQPAPKNMLFNVASVTKVVFSMLVLKLTNQGSWNLDEPLYKYFVDPDVKNDPRHKKLTTRHILSQQSGFVNWRRNHPTKKLTFDFAPGTKFNYSGEGMEYLRKAVEAKFKKTLT